MVWVNYNGNITVQGGTKAAASAFRNDYKAISL